MSSICIKNNKLYGSFDASKTPSKSILHREIICEMLAGNEVYADCSADDVTRTREIACNMLNGIKHGSAGESATTLRLLVPAMIVLGGFCFDISDRLGERPDIYGQMLESANIERHENSICVGGEILPGKYVVRGDISSQFVSGLLLALPLLAGDSEIVFSGELESRGYCEMTRIVQQHHGIRIEETDNGYFVRGNQKYLACTLPYIEGDASYAANFVCANMLGSEIDIVNLPTSNMQPDSAFGKIAAERRIDVSQTPDLFPILAVLACARDGKTTLCNAKRLRYKECDRLHAMAEELKKLGADITEEQDALTVCGHKLIGCRLKSHNDHRIVFALTMAAQLCENDIIIDGCEAINKSAPHFFDDFALAGGKIKWQA